MSEVYGKNDKQWKTPEGREFVNRLQQAFFKQAMGKEAQAEEERKKKQQQQQQSEQE